MKIRTRLLLILALFTALAAIALDLAAGRLIDRAVLERGFERLSFESAHLAAQLEPRWPEATEADALVRQAGESLRARVTLIDPSGRVLADSHVPLRDVPGMENHLDRPEILEAARRGMGRSSRRSTSVDSDMHYVARRVGPPAAPTGFIRLAVAAEDLRAVSRGYRLSLTLISVACFVLLGAIAYMVVRRFSQPIEAVSRAADEVASGRYDAAIGRVSDDEIGELAGAVERMRRSLIEQIGRADSERRLLASVLSGLHEGILVVNQERRLLLVNESFRRSFGITREVPEGTPMVQLVWDRAVVEPYDECLTGQQAVRRRVSLPGGRSCELTVVPFSDGAGRHAGAIGLFFDVTRLEALERVRREFVADISHELRTPLASLRASVETLLGGALSEPEQAERFLNMLGRNASRMEAILNDLTDLSLIETGAIALSPGPVDLASAVRDAAAAVAPRAAARRVTIESRVPPGLSIRADRRRLDQILVNLLDNAVKFNRVGGSVWVSSTPGDGAVSLAVEDTGAGIPPDALDRVFHRFYRVDRARSQEVAGTGLGLAIVKHLVRLHGGRISAENREGSGTRMVLVLPLVGPSRS